MASVCDLLLICSDTKMPYCCFGIRTNHPLPETGTFLSAKNRQEKRKTRQGKSFLTVTNRSPVTGKVDLSHRMAVRKPFLMGTPDGLYSAMVRWSDGVPNRQE